jgi:hypothetical protein
MHTYGISVTADEGNRSAKVAISTASAQSAVYGTSSSGAQLLVIPDVACFMRAGVNPTAVVDADMYLLPNTTYRVQLGLGFRLAFITATGTGNVYITPELGA